MKGMCASEKFDIRTGRGLERGCQRMLLDPDIVVEVKDGKIHALSAGMHRDP